MSRGRFINGQFLTGDGTPVNIICPDFVGQLYHDITNDVYYRSNGLNKFNWTEMPSSSGSGNDIVINNNIMHSNLELSGDGITDIIFDDWVEFGHGVDVIFVDNPDLVNVSFASLTTTGNTNEIASSCEFTLNNNPALTTINLPAYSLIRANGGIHVTDCDALLALPLPALATLGVGATIEVVQNALLASIDLSGLLNVGLVDGSPAVITITSNPLLTTITFGNFLVKDGANLDFSGNALNAATVNRILARCAASASYANGTLDLSGGTNAAPTGQGIADKATIAGRGVGVATN